MLRFLRIFSSKKRARGDPKKSSGSSRKGPLAAGAERRKPGIDSQPLAAVMKERRRPRWEAPELEGPEFSGLIERRATDTRGLMPEPYISEPEPGQKERGPSQLGTDPGHVHVPQSGETESDTSTTGVFLSALDVSAIRLADSGKFKVGDEDDVRRKEQKRRYAGRYNPYEGD